MPAPKGPARSSKREPVMRAVIRRRGGDPGSIGEYRSFPGGISQGTTKAESPRYIKEAIEGWIETMTVHGQPIRREDRGP
jgi:predicted RNase H-like HicB family nuclease